MSSAELASWYDFDTLSPLGGERLDWNIALVCYTLAMIHGGRKMSAKLADFVLRFGPQDKAKLRRKSRDEIIRKLQDAAAAGAEERNATVEYSEQDESRKRFAESRRSRRKGH